MGLAYCMNGNGIKMLTDTSMYSTCVLENYSDIIKYREKGTGITNKHDLFCLQTFAGVI